MISDGDQFGRWTVINAKAKGGALCRCTCGTERVVRRSNLTGPSPSRSCGCLKREVTAALRRSHTTGYEDYRYRLWQTIKGKCLRPTHQDYAYYGGRGVLMHEPWQQDFAAFRDWLDENLGLRPDRATLDRINNRGNYEPGNLRWATRREQAMNRRSRWRNRELE